MSGGLRRAALLADRELLRSRARKGETLFPHRKAKLKAWATEERNRWRF